MCKAITLEAFFDMVTEIALKKYKDLDTLEALDSISKLLLNPPDVPPKSGRRGSMTARD